MGRLLVAAVVLAGCASSPQPFDVVVLSGLMALRAMSERLWHPAS